MRDLVKIVPPQKVLGKDLKTGNLCIHFPAPTAVSGALLRVVGGHCPKGNVKAVNLFSGKEVHIAMETHMLIIKG
jgi:hypothetical protein